MKIIFHQVFKGINLPQAIQSKQMSLEMVKSAINRIKC